MKLNPEFKRDMQSHYLVIKDELSDEDGGSLYPYNLKMLLNNKIPRLLNLELRVIDNQVQYYYDITSKRPLQEITEKGYLNYIQIKDIMLGIIDGIRSGKEFLLCEDDFVIDPEFIYVELPKFHINLCHVVGYKKGSKEQINGFIEYLMNKVDYKDESAVILIYGLYKLASEDGCTFEKLLELIQKRDKKASTDKKINTDKKLSTDDDIELINGMNINGSRMSNNYEDLNKHNYVKNNMQSSEIKQQKDIKKTADIKQLRELKKTSTQKQTNEFKQSEKIKSESNKKDLTRSKGNSGAKKNGNQDHVYSNGHKNNMPLMRERLQSEEEVSVYSKRTIIIIILSIIIMIMIGFVLWKKNLLNNAIGNKLDTMKVFGAIIVIGSVEMYVLSKLLSKEKKETKIVSKVEYVDINKINQSREYEESKVSIPMRSSGNNMDIKSKEEIQVEMNENTVLLAVLNRTEKYQLTAIKRNEFADIEIEEFPFFIGKVKTKVDYAINNSAISRYHVKIEKEEESFFITDLNTTNGTYVNGVKLDGNERKEIFLEDDLMFAHIKYHFQLIE